MRILVANTPRMYRESLALAIRRHRPDFEVLVASPELLDGEAERFGPQVLVRDDDGEATDAPDGVACWLGIVIDNHLNARICVGGRITGVHDVGLGEFLAALEECESLMPRDSAPRP